MGANRMGLFVFLFAFLGFSFSASSIHKEEVRKKLLNVQIPFIKNEGQVDRRVKFYARTFGGTLFVTEKGELVYSLPEKEGKAIALKETLINSRIKAIRGKERAITRVSYFKGKPENWRSNIPTYLSVSMGEVYRGIELELKAYGGNVEKIFRIKPGSSPEKIKIRIEGGELSVDKETGELVVKTELGEVRFTKPVAYQEVEGRRKEVKVSYTLIDRNTYGFKVGKYDRNRELVIDPLLASTYLGGSDYDWIYTISIDSSGNVYVAGYTSSTDFPITSGAFQTTNAGGDEAFVSKFSFNLPPSVSFFVANPQTGYVPLTVTFSWNVSDPDGDTLTCYLDIDNDGNTDYTINNCANNTSQQHTYNNAGNYIAKLTVDDGRGGTVSQNVSVVVNAMVYYTLSISKTGTGDGTVTSNPSGIDCGNSCQAQFSDGTTVILTATPSQGSVFSGWGGDCSSCGTNTYCIVTLTTDLNCSAQFDINQPPQINSFTASPSSGTAPLTVNFTCDAVDPDGSVVEYRWDFEGDGQINTITTSNTATFTYNSGGTYTAKCTAVDNLGATAVATVTVKVIDGTGGSDDNTAGGCSSASAGYTYMILFMGLLIRLTYRLIRNM